MTQWDPARAKAVLEHCRSGGVSHELVVHLETAILEIERLTARLYEEPCNWCATHLADCNARHHAESLLADALRIGREEVEAAIERLSTRPGPMSEGTWAKDYAAARFWMGVMYEVWDAIPVEFRGDPFSGRTLVEKVRGMAGEIDSLRSAKQAAERSSELACAENESLRAKSVSDSEQIERLATVVNDLRNENSVLGRRIDHLKTSVKLGAQKGYEYQCECGDCLGPPKAGR